MKLTPHMRFTLETAQATGELRRMADTRTATQRKLLIDSHANPLYVHPPEWPAPSATLAALVRHGLLDQGERRNRRGLLMLTWQINDAGIEALKPKKGPHKDAPRIGRYMGPASGLVMVGGTWQPVRQPEPEEVKPADLSPSHGREAQRRWDEAQDRRAQARRHANRLRAA